MTPYAAVAVKSFAGAAVAMILGAVAVSAAGSSPNPSSTAPTAQQASADRHADRRAVRRAVVEAEADVLGVKPEALVQDLKNGQNVSDLATARGMSRAVFAARLAANLKPRLQALVDHKTITQPQADRVLDRIARGHVPFWDGVHRRR